MINNRQNGRRRGRGGQQPRNGQSNPYSNNRIDNRQRGNAAQLLEKYKTLARDAQMAGDRVNTEYYLQFADHYFRVLSENRARFEEQQGQRNRPRDDYAQDDEGDGEEEANPFTRPYASRDAAAEENWDDEDGDGQAPPVAQQPSRDRREFQPRDRRPAQSDRGDRPEREGQGDRDGGERRGYRQRGNGAPAPTGTRRAAEPIPSDAVKGEEAPARIEIALPPALTMSPADTTPAPTGTAAAAPELPMGLQGEPMSADEAPAPKRRRTRKPKADAAPAEA